MVCRCAAAPTETTLPEFVLDMGSPEAARRFNDLDHFTQGYITAAFWTEADENGNPLEASFASLAPETLAQMIEDCTSFNQIADVWLVTYAGTCYTTWNGLEPISGLRATATVPGIGIAALALPATS
jgi:hypothetical protein